MNKALKEKLLFITGGVVAIFGLVIFQQNFPSSLDSSKFLAQVPGENIYEECISDPTKIIQNGNFEQFTNAGLDWDYSYYFLSENINGWNDSADHICFFEGYPNFIFWDFLLESNVLQLRYVRHVFNGNPEYYLFNSHQSDGVMQYLGNLTEGSYDISFDVKKATTQTSSDFLRLYIGLSDSLINRTYNPSGGNGCDYIVTNLSTNLSQFTKKNNFEDCVLSQLDSYTYVDITSENYETYVATLNVSEAGPKYVYLFPFGPSPSWDVGPWISTKPFGYLYMDNISIISSSSTCAVDFQGESDLYYSNLDGDYILHNSGPIDVNLIGNGFPPNNNSAFYLYSPAPGILNVKAPTDVEYTDADIFELFSLQGGSVISATSFSGSNFWIEYECLIACAEFSEDLNQDGIVDEMDIEAFMPFFGQFCSNLETCQFDLDNDEIITVQDLMILISAVGQECGLPISPSASNPDETSGPENATYSSQGNFVKPTKIPGLQKPYNYIVNTKVLDTKQTALRIEQFFPSNMILRGLYSSTKNISLVSKEGIVKFFNLGKTTAVKSYLYLEADPEICKTVSQNKKAYTELVSYGLCK